MKPEEFLEGHPVAEAVYEKLTSRLADFGPYEVRASKSQIAFRRKRGFAYVWLPQQYLRNADAEAVLSIPLGRHDRSARFKEVAHPAPRIWMHHLELHHPDQLDDEVVDWLREAFERAD